MHRMAVATDPLPLLIAQRKQVPANGPFAFQKRTRICHTGKIDEFLVETQMLNPVFYVGVGRVDLSTFR